MKNKGVKKLAWQWLEKGNHDLEDAKKLFKNEGYPDTICYHCHQAAEKYLKGFLIFNNVNFRKIHDLVILLEDCHRINNGFKTIFDNCKRLNKYYIEARYPAETPILYSKEEVKEALMEAEKILDFIAEKISTRPVLSNH